MTTYTYDNLDRVSSKTTPDGTVSYTYTADGKISTVTDSTGTTTFTYNSMDGLTRVDYPDGNYVSYKYDKSNRLTKVSTAFGDTAYQYDALDRITRVVDRNGYATVYEYDANGNRTAVKYANGLTVSYEYDKLNRLICEETIDSDSNVVVKYVYTLGASGERLKSEELDRTVEYTYDSLYRLTSETIIKGKTKTTYTYAYDSVSNRTLKNVNGVETTYVYNELNQLVSEDGTTYEYDNAGNLVRVVGAGKTALYVYNADNKLVKATVQQGNNVVVETYTYDYAGNRTSKTTTINNHVEKVYYLNDNSSLTNVLAEYSANGDEICYYTVGADLVSQEVNGKIYTYLYDGHGTVRALANENGKVTDTYCYDAFGNLISSTGSTANSYRYCGEQFDSTTGLYYLRARYMNPSVGRFISMDTYQGSNADPISLHKYLYANSNPVTYTDPSGFYADNMAAAAGMAILDQTVQLNAIGIFNSIMAGLAITLTPVVGTLLTQYLLLQIDNIASGNTTSAEANEEARDETVGDAGGSGSGTGGPNKNDDDWAKFVKEVKKMVKEYGADTYSNFKLKLKNKGFEIHHLIEKRFASLFNIDQSDFLSIPLTKELHRVFTNLWRDAIGYSNSSAEITTQTANKDAILNAVKKIYGEWPTLLKLIEDFIEKNMD